MKDLPLYVIGHKNPDTDAIVSAIAYAQLKNSLGEKAVAGRLGGINSETEYLLKRFGFEEPLNLFSAKCTLKDLELDEVKLIKRDLTTKDALDLVMKAHNRSLFVADGEEKLEGVIANDDFNKLWTAQEEELQALMQTIDLDDIIKTLAATVFYRDAQFTPSGIVEFFPTYTEEIARDSFVIVGNTPEIQRHALDYDIALLVIVGERWVDDLTLKKAAAKRVSVIATKLSPLSVSRLIFQAIKVKYLMTPQEKVISFETNDTIDEVGAKMAQSRYHSYPVLNRHGRIVGSISRFHLLNYRKKRFVLVDHNETGQSINDIESGEVVEIVDHHRLGGLETVNPIKITTMTVGSTSTIIALKYAEAKVTLSAAMAGLLLGGIIADTMNFKSPTTTQIDRETADKLAQIAAIATEELAKGLIDAAESILNKRNIEIVYGDFKEFSLHRLKIGLAQTPIKNYEEFTQVKDKVAAYLEEVCLMQRYDFLTVMFTLTNGSGSYLLSGGKKKKIVADAFGELLTADGFLPEVISRKKQLLPRIIETLEVK